MEPREITSFQFKRVSPFDGLMIDAEAWRDAHTYHRDHQRLHVLAFHRMGVVRGLKVTANSPADQSVVISPGMGVDPEGNVIILPQAHRHRLETRGKALIYLVIQFREVPTGPNQPPEGGQPTRVLEAYRIQERDKLPDEAYLELARVDYDPSDQVVKDAVDPSKPTRNEIDLRFRVESGTAPVGPAPRVVFEAPPTHVAGRPSATVEPPPPRVGVTVLGHVVLGSGRSDLHVAGLRALVREAKLHGLEIGLREGLSLGDDVLQCQVLYLTGNTRFTLNPKQLDSLREFLGSGGLVFGEGCPGGQTGLESRGAKEFGLAFNELAGQFRCKLENVQRGHHLLSCLFVYSSVPQGAEPGMILAGGRMVYSASDYGCAWQGGRDNQPLPRETIRSSIELSTNIIFSGKDKK